MVFQPFTIAEKRPLRPGMTISRPLHLGQSTGAAWFSLGAGLTPHRAPGNAILTALDGKATIGYEGHDYELTVGQSFRFEKNGLHSVTANAKFKMSLLLVLE